MNFSIIVPIYNTPYLWDFFECCRKQEYALESFEIIIVDDWSEEKYKSEYKVFLKHFKDLHLHYIYMNNKNWNFRVNEARNIWASTAKYDNLIFLDWDTLIPSYYLVNIKRSIASWNQSDILIGESIGYNFDNNMIIDSIDIVWENYNKYLQNSEFDDFRRSWWYKHFWHVFLGWNFYISRKTLETIWPWNETINNWWEDDIEFAFRAYKKGLSFAFRKNIEVYNIATGPRLTREKYYSTMKNQHILFKYFKKDQEYLNYVLDRFHHTPNEFKHANIPELFLKEILIPYYEGII